MPSENDLDVDLLMETVEEYRRIKAEHDKKRENSHGSWGYYGSHLADELKDARNALKSVLRSVIKSEVESILKSINQPS